MPEHDHTTPEQDNAATPAAYYVRLGENSFIDTRHAQGTWHPDGQHLAVAAGLLLAQVERRLPSSKLIARVSFDVFGTIGAGEFTIDVAVVRPGRTIELVEATLRNGDRISIQARIWRLAGGNTTALQGLEWTPLPPPEQMPAFDIAAVWDGGFLASLEVRREATARPGRGRSWVRSPYPLVAGEEDPPTAGFVKLVDIANGLVARASVDKAFFANVDLGIHLIRAPVAGWVGFDTRVSFGPSGLGETFSVLSDVHGPVGTAAQALTVRPTDS